MGEENKHFKDKKKERVRGLDGELSLGEQKNGNRDRFPCFHGRNFKRRYNNCKMLNDGGKRKEEKRESQ